MYSYQKSEVAIQDKKYTDIRFRGDHSRLKNVQLSEVRGGHSRQKNVQLSKVRGGHGRQSNSILNLIQS